MVDISVVWATANGRDRELQARRWILAAFRRVRISPALGMAQGVRRTFANHFSVNPRFAHRVLAANPPTPPALRALSLHPALPERAQCGVVKRQRGRNLPEMIVVG